MGLRSDEQVLREVVFGVEFGAVGAVVVVLGGDSSEGGEKERQRGGGDLHGAWRQESGGGRARQEGERAQ